MCAAYNKFECFVGDLGDKVHDLQATGDEFKIYLTNNLPDAAADSVKADLAGITEENGYAPADAQNDYTEAGGTGTFTCVDIVFTATPGGFGPFRYVVLFNETPAAPADPLTSWWDYGSSISCADGETMTIDFGASVFTLA